MKVIKSFLLPVGRQIFKTFNHFNENRTLVAVGVAALLTITTGVALAVSYGSNNDWNNANTSITRVVASLAKNEANEPSDNEPLGVLYRSGYTSTDDTADSLLLNLGIVDAKAAAFIRSNSLAKEYLLGIPNVLVLAQAGQSNSLIKLTALWAPANSRDYEKLVIEPDANGVFSSKLETGALTANTQLASGMVSSTFYDATSAARMPFAVASQVHDILSPKVNFRTDLHAGARFSVIYETLEGDGQPLRSGRVLGVELINNGKKYHAIWFDPTSSKGKKKQLASNNGGYYTLSGESLTGHKFLSSPIRYARISSPFGERFDPYLHKWHFHEGVDLAAPSGTPIHSVGAGRVTFAGVQRGYGNVVIVQHADDISTLYAHMSKILVRTGQTVPEGKVIGQVGETGWATGPHLHFEFRVNDVHKNPLVAMAKYGKAPLANAYRAQFEQKAFAMRTQLNQAIVVGSSDNMTGSYQNSVQ